MHYKYIVVCYEWCWISHMSARWYYDVKKEITVLTCDINLCHIRWPWLSHVTCDSQIGYLIESYYLPKSHVSGCESHWLPNSHVSCESHIGIITKDLYEIPKRVICDVIICIVTAWDISEMTQLFIRVDVAHFVILGQKSCETINIVTADWVVSQARGVHFTTKVYTPSCHNWNLFQRPNLKHYLQDQLPSIKMTRTVVQCFHISCFRLFRDQLLLWIW